MKTQVAVLAAGCFWGVQYYFDQIPGVIRTEVGYTGGHTPDPSYDQVATQHTGHVEAVRIEFDPNVVSYRTLVRQFFRMHDPTTLNRQGPDVGDEYRSALFYTNQEQHKEAVLVRNERQKQLGVPIMTQIERATMFYPAEAFHQKFTEKTGLGMCHIPYASV